MKITTMQTKRNSLNNSVPGGSLAASTEQDAARGIAVGLTRFMEDNIDIILKTNENLFSILDRQVNLPSFGA